MAHTNILRLSFALTLVGLLLGCAAPGSRLDNSNSAPLGDNGFRNPHSHPLLPVHVYSFDSAGSVMAGQWGYAQAVEYSKLVRQGSEVKWTRRVVGDGVVTISVTGEDAALCRGAIVIVADKVDESGRLRINERQMRLQFSGPAAWWTANDFTAEYSSTVPEGLVPYVLVADVVGELYDPSMAIEHSDQQPWRCRKVALFLTKENGIMSVEPLLETSPNGFNNPTILAIKRAMFSFMMFRVK